VADDLRTLEQLAADLQAGWSGVRRRLRRSGRAAVGGAPLSGSQVELLRLVERRPGIGVAEAARELHLAPNTVSTLVRGLSAEELLLRTPDPLDGRAARLELTARAAARLRRWRDERARVLTAALAALAPADRDALEASLPALDRLLRALEATA
jgi:DNA-binding MarR family transcriptional regulator